MSDQSPFAVRLGNVLFRYRSYIPIPLFLAVAIFARFDPFYMVAGILIAIMGETLRFIGVGYAGYSTRTTRVGAESLVTSGPFAQVRNPLYVGNNMVVVGLALASGSLVPWLPIGIFLFVFIYYYFIVRAEEAFLFTKFGEVYLEYKKAVPRFLPRLIPWEKHSDHIFDGRIAWRSERRTFQTIIIMCIAIALAMIAKTQWLHWDF